jgi:hypothetical protein
MIAPPIQIHVTSGLCTARMTTKGVGSTEPARLR